MPTLLDSPNAAPASARADSPDKALTDPAFATGQGHHLLLPWSVGLSDACQKALPTLDDPGQWPHLHHLLERLTVQDWDRGDEYQLTPPHERVLAKAFGWPARADGQGPWAALQARQDGLNADSGAWGLLTPCHWLLGRDHLTLLHPDVLDLNAVESRALLDAVRELFESEGWTLRFGAPTRWYATHESLEGLPTASLDRVLGRNPDLWMPGDPRARMIKRLQSEVQMLLYDHPINEAREARGALSVNSFWLSGCGALAPATPWRGTVLDAPRQALLRDDLEGWLAAWRALERDALREAAKALRQGLPVSLTLCGERHVVRLSSPAGATGLAGWIQAGWRASVGALGRPRARPSAILALL